jgi:two-component system, NtrC family, sensor kinase
LRAEASSGAIRILRLTLAGAIILPLLLAAVGGYFSYRANLERAAAALTEAVAVAEENTLKVLDTHVLVAARIDDALAGLTDGEIRSEEKSLHDRLALQITDLPQVAAAWVIDADGRELVSARVYPVDRSLDHSGRDDFRALQSRSAETYIWALRARSLESGDYQPYFTLARRRQPADAPFRGIVVVAVSGSYFASFYNSLLGGSTEHAASVFREDGTSLARYPAAQPSAPTAAQDALLTTAIASKATSGIIAGGSPFDPAGRLVAFKRIASYPVYVAIGRSRASILRDWLASVWGYVAFGAPAAAGFVLLSLLSLRRTRREQRALAAARDAIAQRAALEAQLHQAQKMEAVGLLTAGIAHDFNNLLTIISGNITLLEMGIEPSDPSRRKFVAGALSGCERAADLTKRLLDFSRRRPADPRVLDVNGVILGIADLLRRSLGDHVVADFQLSDRLWPVVADPSQLESCLLNLALNARDAMTGRGRLTIQTVDCHLDDADAAAHPGLGAGDYVAIFVADTGCGMPPEVREKAFDPFFTTKDADKGTGLGLSQVHGFITRSGGHCTIDSEIGRGTTINLYLPRYAGDAAAAEAAEATFGSADEPTAIEAEADNRR